VQPTPLRSPGAVPLAHQPVIKLGSLTGRAVLAPVSPRALITKRGGMAGLTVAPNLHICRKLTVLMRAGMNEMARPVLLP